MSFDLDLDALLQSVWGDEVCSEAVAGSSLQFADFLIHDVAGENSSWTGERDTVQTQMPTPSPTPDVGHRAASPTVAGPGVGEGEQDVFGGVSFDDMLWSPLPGDYSLTGEAHSLVLPQNSDAQEEGTVVEPWTCQNCGKAYKRKSSLVRHWSLCCPPSRESHPRSRSILRGPGEAGAPGVTAFLVCPSCDRRFWRSSSLRDHVVRVHSEVEAPAFRCVVTTCDFKAFNPYHVKRHLHTVHFGKDWSDKKERANTLKYIPTSVLEKCTMRCGTDAGRKKVRCRTGEPNQL